MFENTKTKSNTPHIATRGIISFLKLKPFLVFSSLGVALVSLSI
jgi:hypothetical protein